MKLQKRFHGLGAKCLLAAIVPAMSLFAVDAGAAERRETPNIVLFVADDLGYQELGCYGQKWIQTPHIDRIAENGILFTQFYSGNAVCAPSRCNLMTGKHPGHAFIRNNGDPKNLDHLKEKYGWEFPGQFPIPESEVTIAEMLKQKNYATGAMGKWGLGHIGTTGAPNNQGFDLFYGYYCQRHAHNHYPKFLWRNAEKEFFPGNDRTLDGETHSNDRFTEVALDFVRENRDRPFFLYVPFIIPHLSIQTTEKWLEKYKDVIPEEEYEHRGYLEHPYPRAGYAAMVSQIDDTVGQVMTLIEELELEGDTLVMFTSDNGPTFDRLGGSDSEFFESAGPFRGLKGSLYEGGIRVPMVAQWPGKIPPRQRTNLLSAFWDILPTIAEVTGTTPPKGIDGISFAPTLLGDDDRQKRHEYLYWEFPGYGGQQAVRLGPWKGIRQNMARRNNPDPLHIELYHLVDDIGEDDDVSAEHPEVVDRIETIMKDAHTPSELFPLRPIDTKK